MTPGLVLQLAWGPKTCWKILCEKVRLAVKPKRHAHTYIQMHAHTQGIWQITWFLSAMCPSNHPITLFSSRGGNKICSGVSSSKRTAQTSLSEHERLLAMSDRQHDGSGRFKQACCRFGGRRWEIISSCKCCDALHWIIVVQFPKYTVTNKH